MNIVVTGRIPSKKNSKSAFVIRGRAIITDNPAYKKWHKDASKQIQAQRTGSLPLKGVNRVFFTFFAPDARTTDLSNKWESVADLLVDCGIIQDDNCNELPSILLQFGGIDRANPRAEVLLQ